jgi:CRP/FNR family cyclic AMP-dependent transcriptional regulator
MQDTAAIALLRQVPLFAGLDDALLKTLLQHSRRRKFNSNETLFHEGDPGYTLYLIVSGRVNIQRWNSSGEVVHIAQRGAGEHFGELSLIDGKPRMADVVTAEPCDLLMLDHADFVRCVEQSAPFAVGIMANLADRLRQAASHLEKRGLDVSGRVAEALLNLVADHGVDDPAGGKRINLRITQQTLAEQVGTTRESVSRALSGMRDSRAVRLDGRAIVVLNEQKLRRYCAL